MPDTEPKPKAPRGRVAYLMSWFPAPTETFILHELLELRRQGLEVDVFPLLGAAPGPRHPGAEEMVARTRYHRGLSGEVVAAQLHWLRKRPVAYLRAWGRALRGNLRSPGSLARAAVVVPRAAFIAHHVDGVQSMRDILDICAMPEAEALDVFGRLQALGMISLD